MMDLSRQLDDTRIDAMRALIPPAILMEEIPLAEASARFVLQSRQATDNIIHGQDDRLLAIVGPCSIHDTDAAIDYAKRLLPLAQELREDLLVVMRVYFEKPRTVVGWKGLINDPGIDGSFQINKGLRLARRLLAQLADMGLATGTEFLDTIMPQFIADLVTWSAIGARTTESQCHRELASGLSMPVGFKNGTDGQVQIAVDACAAARVPHWFTSVTKQGVSAIFSTTGNPSCHLILRGGNQTGPNYGTEAVGDAITRLRRAELDAGVLVDCSHGNSKKDFRRQEEVCASICEQVASGSRSICGTMIESHLVEGRQDWVPGRKAVYGQSITDACLSFEDTEPLLRKLADAARQRREQQPAG